MAKKFWAELIGTMVLVIFWCWVAVRTNADTVSTALAFGLVIIALAYAIGQVSGCHVNPAVSLWVWMSWKMTSKEFRFYILAQFIWWILWAALLGVILGNFSLLWANGTSLVNWMRWIAVIVEIILTFVFVFAVIWVTSNNENWCVAWIVIGWTLTLVHLLWLWFTGTSVNPARSFWPALLQWIGWDWGAFCEVWIFIVAPLIGATLAALLFKYFNKKKA